MSPDDVILLTEARDYRDFLQRAFDRAAAGSRRFSYASFARRAGFASRSFPRDVVLAKKRLSYESANRFAAALKLTGDLKTYFLTMVAIEEAGVRVPSMPPRPELEKTLQKIKSRLRSKAAKVDDGLSQQFYGTVPWLEIYASLGFPDVGATLAEIERRSGISGEQCDAVLLAMQARGIVRRDATGERFIARDPHLIFKNLGGDYDFKRSFLEALLQARKRAVKNATADDALFFSSMFSVAQAQMPRLKSELRDVMLKFIDHVERPDGDQLARLTLAFYAK